MRDIVFNVWSAAEDIIGSASNAFGTGHFILSAIHDEGEHTLTMTLDATDSRAELFANGNLVGFHDADGHYQLFEVKEADLTAADGSTLELYAEHVRYELATDPLRDIRPTNTSVANAISQGLAGTRWSLGAAVDAGSNSARGYYTDVLSYLTEVAGVWGVELEYEVTVARNRITGRYVHARTRLGSYRGRRFEYAKDTQTIKGYLSTSGIYTALVGRGRGEAVGETEEGDATFGRRIRFDQVAWSIVAGDPADKPLGDEFIEDPQAKAQFGIAGGTRNRVGFVVFSQIEDPIELLQATWEKLQEVKTPRASYKLSVMDLEQSEGLREAVRMGDTVLVIHRAVKPAIELMARVIRIRRDLLSPEATTLELGDARSMVSDRINKNQKLAEKAQSINENGTFPTDHLQGAIDALKNQLVASGGYDHAEVLQNKGILLENTNVMSDAFGALYLGPGIFAIAGSKEGDDWDWRTFGTGQGFTGDEITTGTIRAGLVRILGTDRFLWDAENIIIQDPDDMLREIRIGLYDGAHYGIGFTADGGATWQNALGFDGITISAGDSVITGLWQHIDGIDSTISGIGEDVDDLQRGLADAETNHAALVERVTATEFAVTPGEIVSRVRGSELYQQDLAAKADGSTVTQLTTRVSEAEQKITPGAIVSTVRGSESYREDLAEKADGTTVTALATRITQAELKITSDAIVSTVRGSADYKGDLSGKADATDVTALAGRVAEAEQKITPGAITSTVRSSDGYQEDLSGKASTSDVTALTGRVAEAEQKITPSAIVSTVRESDDYKGDLSTKSTTYYGPSAPSEPNIGDLWMDSLNDNLMKRFNGTAWEDVQDGQISVLMQSTGGLVAAVGNNRLSFSAAGLQIMNAQGTVVFKQDSATGALDITGILRALGGTIGPLTVSATSLTYGSQLSIDTSAGYARIKIGNILLKNANSSTYGLIYGPEEAPYFAASESQVYFGKSVVVTPSAMPSQVNGTLLTYNRMSGQVGSGFKIICGTVNINDSSASDINFSAAGFTSPPMVVATYSKTGANQSGDSGAIKVYNKTTYGATIIIGGTFPALRQVDWIAIGM